MIVFCLRAMRRRIIRTGHEKNSYFDFKCLFLIINSLS